jgi:uncharacterized protein
MHLSVLCNNAIQARPFYCNILGCEERRTTFTSVSLDWFGSQLTIHQLDSYSAKKMLREVEGDDLPAPHFGAVIGENQFLQVASRLKQAAWTFVIPPYKRFSGGNLEHWILVVPRSFGQRDRVEEFDESASGYMGGNRFGFRRMWSVKACMVILGQNLATSDSIRLRASRRMPNPATEQADRTSLTSYSRHLIMENVHDYRRR